MTTTAQIPRAKGIPVLGAIPYYFRDPTGYLEANSRLGDIVELHFLKQRAWIVSDPALIEQVLLKQASSFHKDHFLRELKKYLGEGLLTSEGARWKRQRRLIQPAFHRQHIDGYGQVMVDAATRMVSRWQSGQTLEIHHEMMSLTADIVTRCLFGTDLQDTSEVSWCIERIMERFSDPLYLLFPSIERLPLPANRKYNDVIRRLDVLVRGFISTRRKQGKDAPDNDLLAMLLNARDEDGTHMDDTAIRDELLILFLAGHETTALALSWCLYLISENPEVERRLHAELDATLDGRLPTLADLPKLKYAEAVIQETLRLRPPAWSLGRESIEPVELGGRRFEADSWIWILPWTIHRDPRWYNDPLRFDPSRWEDGLAKRLPKYAYLPFGGGPRVCIGQQFAMMEGILLLAVMAQRFSFRTAAGHRVEHETSVTLRFKHGLRMTLGRRA
jgi:cytochrome P450